MLKAIETVHNGYRFRSRLEARWAVFFDTLGIEYQYEPEGYELSNGEWYLPDFYLPQHDLWIEIKGDWPTDAEKLKAKLLCEGTMKSVAIFAKECWYVPACAFFMCYEEDKEAHDVSYWDDHYEWAYTGVGSINMGWRAWGIVRQHGEDYIGTPKLICLLDGSSVEDATHSKIQEAYVAARQARFEHNGI